jgi:LacI family transcriptional regulator
VAVTRSDVARLAKVSPAVVSYVLNNGPRPVSAGARARVEDAVRQLGYRPNAIAAALRAGSTRSIGFLTPDPRDPFLAELGNAFERQLRDLDYLVLTGNTYYDRSREERYLQTFIDRNVDAIILAPGVSLAGSPVQEMTRPIVSLDLDTQPPNWSTIHTCDLEDSITAVEHLQRHGHRLIGCVAGPRQLASEKARIEGWRRQLAAVGSPTGSELLAFGDISEEGGSTATLQLLSEHGRPSAVHGRRPTALLVTSDAQAVGAISACHELGLRVPDDVAIAGIGGTRTARYTIPPLTTMRQDVEYIATKATEIVMDRLKGTRTSPVHLHLRGNLVVARSCGCPPHSTGDDLPEIPHTHLPMT